MANIMVGLSGGVDSAVSALLLKQAGHEVSGVYMQNWEADREDPHCSAEQDLRDAKAVADHIGIPFQVVNFSKAYWDEVFQHCLDEFAAGRTPNPDVLCNRDIKFKRLLDFALDEGADFLATGHYVDKSSEDDTHYLIKGCDNNKDQSYFLYMLGQKALEKSLFPLGKMEKPDVRTIAENAGLPNCNKKDSTGICFIGERKFKKFLNEYLLAKPGEMKTFDGKLIGKHDGIMFYTIGQRKGLEIGGMKEASEEAWYVIDKDNENNVLIVGQGHDHPRLFSNALEGQHLHWISGELPNEPVKCHAKTRYRQADQACELRPISGDNSRSFSVKFEEPQRAITPGQSIVFYDENICLGGGIIG